MPPPPDLVVTENERFEAALGEAEIECLRRVFGRNLEMGRRDYVISRVVGHVVLPTGRVVRVRSQKAGSAAVLAWSAYVDPRLRALDVLGTAPSAAAEADVGALLAHVLLTELDRVLGAHGLVRSYVRAKVETTSVRGRIDFAALTRAPDASRLPCEVWERRPWTPAMRLLAACIERIARDPVMRAAAPTRLQSLRFAFAQVPAGIDPNLLAGRTTLARNEQPFESAVRLARLLLRHAGLGEGSAEIGVSYIVALDVLFERAVVRALTDAGIRALPKHAVDHVRVDETGKTSQGSAMELDAFCPDLAAGGVVVDAKYKHRASSGNLQQMLAYCALTGARHGVLVFPEGQLDDRRAYRFPTMSGECTVHVAELPVAATTVEQWRNAGYVFAQRLRAIFPTFTRAGERDHQRW